MKLYIDLDNKQRARTIKAFLMQCKRKDGFFKPTFYDKDFRKQQCHAGRRSFEDIVCLVKTYFPKATESSIAKALLLSGGKTYKCYPYFLFCGGILKPVVYFPPVYKYTPLPVNHFSKMNASYKWFPIFKEFEIKSSENLTEFRKKYKLSY